VYPFSDYCYSENLVTPGIEPKALDLQPGSLTTRPQRLSFLAYSKAEIKNSGGPLININFVKFVVCVGSQRASVANYC
jgi:hypothetical protein